MTVSESAAPTKDVSTQLGNGVVGRRVAVTDGSAPSTELQLRLANKADSYGVENFLLGGGSGCRNSESVAIRARDLRQGIKESGAVSTSKAGTRSNPEVVFQSVTESANPS